MAHRWRAVITEDGKHILPDQTRRFQAHLGQFAGEAVTITVERWTPITQDQRGYLRGVLVELYREHAGCATNDEAYDALLREVYCVDPAEIRPSLADAAADGEAVSECIERISAFLTLDLKLIVPEPEPDPVVRWERAS